MSLVAAYGDSDSENSNNSEDINENKQLPQETNGINSTSSQKSSPSSSTNASDDENDEQVEETLTNTNRTSSMNQEDANKSNNDHLPKLPIPGFLTKNTNKSSLQSTLTTSVFANPFAAAENAKKLALEKHVKMVDGGTAIMINGKKVCWNYRKGRCRFGHNCKYAHDSDLQKSAAQLAAEMQIQETVICENMTHNPKRSNSSRKIDSNESISDDESDGNKKLQKRKRPGLTTGLQPGKRVLKQYQKLKNYQHN